MVRGEGRHPRTQCLPPAKARLEEEREEVAAAQRTCPIMEQGEQAKASMEQNQVSSAASVQPSRRGEENRCKRCVALMLSEMQAAT